MSPSPSDFATFWDNLAEELVAVAPQVTLERDDFYSKPGWYVYRAQYSGLDGYRLFAWLSIPRRAGPFPALLRMPDYCSVHDPIYTPLRYDAIVMNATHRGQRHSDSPFQAHYPGLLTEGIRSPTSYVMRRVFGDAVRAVDVLLGQTEAQVTDTCLTGAGLGGSLALAAAMLRPTIKAVAVDTPFMLGHLRATEVGTAYPLDELNDYLRLYPNRRAAVSTSTAPLDPVKLAPRVAAPVLLSLGRLDRGQCPLAVGDELAGTLPNCDCRVYDGAGESGWHGHAVVRNEWLAKQLGICLKARC